jgi:hypothetical protein
LPHPASRATPKRIDMLPIATFFIFILFYLSSEISEIH